MGNPGSPWWTTGDRGAAARGEESSFAVFVSASDPTSLRLSGGAAAAAAAAASAVGGAAAGPLAAALAEALRPMLDGMREEMRREVQEAQCALLEQSFRLNAELRRDVEELRAEVQQLRGELHAQ